MLIIEKTIREPLDIGEKALVFAKRLKKKDTTRVLFKRTTENKPFLRKSQILMMTIKRILFENYYYY